MKAVVEEAVSTNSKKDWRVAAMVVLGYFWGQRHSNLVKVRVEDITIKVQRNRNKDKEYPIPRNIPIPYTRIGIRFENILLLFNRIGIVFLNILYVQNIYRILQNMSCNIHNYASL